jgi:hypothetical protein
MIYKPAKATGISKFTQKVENSQKALVYTKTWTNIKAVIQRIIKKRHQ